MRRRVVVIVNLRIELFRIDFDTYDSGSIFENYLAKVMGRNSSLRVDPLTGVGRCRNIYRRFDRAQVAERGDPLSAFEMRQTGHQVHVRRLIEFLIEKAL